MLRSHGPYGSSPKCPNMSQPGGLDPSTSALESFYKLLTVLGINVNARAKVVDRSDEEFSSNVSSSVTYSSANGLLKKGPFLSHRRSMTLIALSHYRPAVEIELFSRQRSLNVRTQK